MYTLSQKRFTSTIINFLSIYTDSETGTITLGIGRCCYLGEMFPPNVDNAHLFKLRLLYTATAFCF